MDYLISDMRAIAEEKHLQMLELLQLTKDQTRLLAEEDAEMFERYVVYKQNIIDRINSLDARYKELNARLLLEFNLRSIEDLKNDYGVQRILELNIRTKSIIGEMIEIDRNNTGMGKQLLEKLGKALKQAAKAPAVARAYQGDASGAIFINRQG